MATKLLFSNNSKTTLAGSITNVATTLSVAPGAGALFPNPNVGAGQYFVLSLFDAATGLVTEIMKVTARSADTLTVVRAQEGTSARSWTAGDVVGNFWTAGQAQTFFDNVRLGLTGNTIFYVATTGNDANDGLTPATAWLTIQNAFNVIGSNYDLNGFVATIQLEDGTYAGASSGRPMTGGGAVSVVVQGNIVTPNNTIIAATNAALLADGNGSGFTVQYCKLSSSLGNCIQASRNAQVYTGPGLNFGATPNGAHMFCSDASSIRILNDYTISGSAQAHYQVIDGSITGPVGLTMTVSGTPAWAFACVSVINCGTVYVQNPTFSGSATGKRYDVEANGVINTAGGVATTFPGNVAGTTATGGQYI